ncbi:MAG TPA: hypoxanthine-guanine phosphoribosyltransferase [Burkholderiales bacterium]|jgi:hypoxanthine phosphoribosyltransferase
MKPEEAAKMLAEADLLVSPAECSAATARVAQEIKAKMGRDFPLVLAVMGGAVVFAGQLLPLLDFPLEFDYVHVSRYGDRLSGGKLHWRVEPKESVQGRAVLVIDDILDEGETMAAIHKRVLELGAAACYSAVFCEKLLGKPKPARPDFLGITVPNRYVFGYGMDAAGLWRNLPAIYALKES